MNIDAKDFLKAAILAGGVYTDNLHQIGDLNVYSPIKQIPIPGKEKEYKKCQLI